MHMVVYIDGSRRTVPRGTFSEHPMYSDVLGWGMVVLRDDTMVELSGAIPVPRKAEGEHEMLAFVEAVRYIRNTGVPFNSVSIFTDDLNIAYAAQALHPDNFRQTEAGKIRRSVALVCSLVGDADLEAAVLECLMNSRFIKLKAHRFTVYNNRVDYLAAQASLRLTGVPAPVKSYEKWLSRGFQYYTEEGAQRWHAPFSNGMCQAIAAS